MVLKSQKNINMDVFLTSHDLTGTKSEKKRGTIPEKQESYV